MNKICVLFLSAQPVVIAALIGFFLNDALVIPDIEDYKNFFKSRKNNSPNHQVIVFDDGALERNELENINESIFQCDQAKKILYSERIDSDYFDYYLKYEIDGIVSKKAEMKVLKDAVLNVMDDNKFYCKHISKILSQKNDGKNKPELLSLREKEIMLLIADGLKNSEIAGKLFLSNRTIETHKTHIIKKLGLKSTVELMRFAVKNYDELKIV